MRGKYIYLGLVAAFGLGVLYFMLWQARLGDFAESPQEIVVQREATRLVGGGRAGVVFDGPYEEDGARILVRCKNTADVLELEPGQESREICGVRLELVAVTVRSARIVVRWGEPEAPADAAEPS